MACYLASSSRGKPKDQQTTQITDIEFVVTKILVLPQVIAALNVLIKKLFGCNAIPEKLGWNMDEQQRVEWIAIMTKFAQRFYVDQEAFGMAVWDIVPHERLEQVPIIYDFESLEVSFVFDEYGRPAYDVRRNGKRLQSFFVTDKYPPKRDGSLQSPLSRLIPRVTRWEHIHQEACIAIEAAVHPFIHVEPMVDRVSPNVMAQRTAGVPLAGSADMDSFDISLDGARLMNSTVRYQKMCSNDAQQHLDAMLAKLEAPVNVLQDQESQKTFLVLRQGYKFAHGADKPFIPNLAQEDRCLENDISSVLGIPRVYWSESEARFQVDMTLAGDKLKDTVRHWANYLIPILDSIWLKIYQKTEAKMAVTEGAPLTRITLPSIITRHELEDLKENKIINEEQFRRHLAGLYGWASYTGSSCEEEEKQVQSSKETKKSKQDKEAKETKEGKQDKETRPIAASKNKRKREEHDEEHASAIAKRKKKNIGKGKEKKKQPTNVKATDKGDDEREPQPKSVSPASV